MKQYNITLLKGDGIGPEITDSVTKILSEAGMDIIWDEQLAGANAFEKYNSVFRNAHLIQSRKIKFV